MATVELSEQQAKVLLSTTRVVEAGPGSGKTRALVERYLQEAQESTRGIALISFTNAAVDEVRRRASSTPELLRAPHFVGTIDSFLHRFIVTPAEVSRLGRAPIYRASWDDLPDEFRAVHLTGLPGAGIPMSAFRMEQPSTIQLYENGLRRHDHGYLAQVDHAGRRDQLLNAARARISGLNRKGIYDANTARVKAFELLEGTQGTTIVARLTRRFAALLVDESQDCDEAEMGVIRRLAEGIEVTLVADPDQAIFEFRGSKPELFTEYRDEQELAHRCHLSTNYRSSEAICKAVTCLRSAGISLIESVDDGPCSEVLVLGGSPSEQRQKFLDALQSIALQPSQAIVLAHRWADAAEVAGVSAAVNTSTAVGNRLVIAISVLASDPSPARRVDAVQRIEHIILSLLTWEDADVRLTGRERQLEILMRRPDWLRLAAGKVANRLIGIGSRDEFGVAARSVLNEILDPLPVEHAVLSNKVKKPDETVWDSCTRGMATPSELPCSTVHAAKGREFPAVLVALPSSLRKLNGRTVLEDWSGGFNTEPRRVLEIPTID